MLWLEHEAWQTDSFHHCLFRVRDIDNERRREHANSEASDLSSSFSTVLLFKKQKSHAKDNARMYQDRSQNSSRRVRDYTKRSIERSKGKDGSLINGQKERNEWERNKETCSLSASPPHPQDLILILVILLLIFFFSMHRFSRMHRNNSSEVIRRMWFSLPAIVLWSTFVSLTVQFPIDRRNRCFYRSFNIHAFPETREGKEQESITHMDTVAQISSWIRTWRWSLYWINDWNKWRKILGLKFVILVSTKNKKFVPLPEPCEMNLRFDLDFALGRLLIFVED